MRLVCNSCLVLLIPILHTRTQAARGHGEVMVREVGNGQRARHAIAQIAEEVKADILVLGMFGRKHEGPNKVWHGAFETIECWMLMFLLFQSALVRKYAALCCWYISPFFLVPSCV